MTLDQIDFVLRQLGWDGTARAAPVVHFNDSGKVPFALGHKMWIENGLVVLRSNKGSMSWHDASEIVSISPASEFWSDMFKDELDDPPTLRVVE